MTPINSAHKKIPCLLFSGTKGGGSQGFVTRLNRYRPLKETTQTPSIAILNRIRLGWNCFRQRPHDSSIKKMVRPSIPKGVGCLGGTATKRCQVQNFFNMRIKKTGFKNLPFLTVQPLKSRWYHPRSPWKRERHSHSGASHLMFLEMVSNQKKTVAKLCTKKGNLVFALWEQPRCGFADSSKTSEADRQRNWTELQKELVKNSSSSQINVWIMNLLFTKVKTRCQGTNRRGKPQEACKVFDKIKILSS